MAGNGGFSSAYPGILFLPSDEELVDFYLRKMVDGQADENVSGAIPTVDLFGRDAPPPWLLHPAATVFSSKKYSSSSSSSYSSIVPVKAPDWFYCFTRTCRRGSGACRTTKWGTWLSSGVKAVTMETHGGEESVTLGYKNALAFKIPTVDCGNCGSKWVPTNWVMHEFKLYRDGPNVKRKPAASAIKEEEEVVLCRIRCTKPSVLGFPEFLQPYDEESGRSQKRLRTGDPKPFTYPERSQVVLAPATPATLDAAEQERTRFWSNSVEQQVGTPATPDVAVDATEQYERTEFWNNPVEQQVGTPDTPEVAVDTTEQYERTRFWSNPVEQQVDTPATPDVAVDASNQPKRTEGSKSCQNPPAVVVISTPAGGLMNSMVSLPHADGVDDCWTLDGTSTEEVAKDDMDVIWQMLMADDPITPL